jgi:hypothetical protein
MTHLTLRIITTLMMILGVVIDSYNETVDINDSNIHVVLDPFKIVAVLTCWVI